MKTSEEKKNGFAKLFDNQMETLKSRGCPQAILDVFRRKKDEVTSKASEMDIPKGNIPFIPVIPRSYLGIYGLMSMVRNGDKVGYTRLNPNEIIDEVKIPKDPYFIYDVEDGRKYLGKSPRIAEFIAWQKRSCLTVDEGIAVCIHSNVLSEHFVDCTGSRCMGADRVPDVYLSDGVPRLSSSLFDSSLGEWGSPSCRSRA